MFSLFTGPGTSPAVLFQPSLGQEDLNFRLAAALATIVLSAQRCACRRLVLAGGPKPPVLPLNYVPMVTAYFTDRRVIRTVYFRATVLRHPHECFPLYFRASSHSDLFRITSLYTERMDWQGFEPCMTGSVSQALDRPEEHSVATPTLNQF